MQQQFCPSGENWNQNYALCEAPPINATACTLNSDCSSGQTCVSGSCVTQSTSTTACNTQGQCVAVASGTGDSSGCLVSANTKKANVKCTPAIITQAQIVCIGAAVNTREAAIDMAMTAYTTSVNNAYSTRATALQLAYQLTTLKAVQSTVKTTWTNFSNSTKVAKKTWQTARNAAWAQYVKTANACKAASGTGDGGYVSYEVAGS